uniref:Uncharacterized protein n=1 Tax=viral metagenome TaxID=1070528 RepID=A0A6H2A4R2_9ZZZZ
MPESTWSLEIYDYAKDVVKAVTILGIAGLAWKTAVWIVQGIMAL